MPARSAEALARKAKRRIERRRERAREQAKAAKAAAAALAAGSCRRRMWQGPALVASKAELRAMLAQACANTAGST